MEGADYEYSDDVSATREVISDFRTHVGRSEAKRKTSPGQIPPAKHFRRMERLSPEAIEVLYNAGKEAIARAEPPSGGSGVESVNGYYAEELVGKLDGIVPRASALEKLDPKDISNQSLVKYFEEAHSCFLYGFRVAGAVLCRAMLETALKELFDPDSRIERTMKAGESYF
jgi:hypothetical protein